MLYFQWLVLGVTFGRWSNVVLIQIALNSSENMVSVELRRRLLFTAYRMSSKGHDVTKVGFHFASTSSSIFAFGGLSGNTSRVLDCLVTFISCLCMACRLYVDTQSYVDD